MRKANVLFAAVSILLFLHGMVYGESGKEKTITLLCTSSLNGNLDGCACMAEPKAGLVKRAAYLRNHKDTSILVDAGDMFDAKPDERLSHEIMEVYKELGYDAVALGDQDFSEGVDRLLSKRKEFPFLANNVRVFSGMKQWEAFSAEPLLVSRGGLRIGVFSIIDPDVLGSVSRNVRDRLKIDPPKAALSTLVKQLKDADLRVLLYHGPYENAKKLVRSVKGIDVAVVGHEQYFVESDKVGGTILVSPGEQGNRIGMLSLTVADKKIKKFSADNKLFIYELHPDDPSVRERVNKYFAGMTIQSQLDSKP